MAFNLGFPAYSPLGASIPRWARASAFGARCHRTDDVDLHHHVGPARSRGGDGGQPVRRAHHLITGSLMIVAGATVMATVVDSALGAYLAFGLLVGGGVCTGGALPARPRCRAGSCAAARMALSIMYSAGAHRRLRSRPNCSCSSSMRTGDWRDAWWVIVGLSALAAVLALVFVREKPEDMGQAVDGVTDADMAAAARRPRDRKPAFITDYAVGIPRCRAQPHLLADPGFAGGRQRQVHAVPRARQAAARGFRSCRGHRRHGACSP